MGRYIQDKNGRMMGRIGDGITPPKDQRSKINVEMTPEQADAVISLGAVLQGLHADAASDPQATEVGANLTERTVQGEFVACYAMSDGGYATVEVEEMDNPRSYGSDFVIAEAGDGGADETGITGFDAMSKDEQVAALRAEYPGRTILGYRHGWDETFAVMEYDYATDNVLSADEPDGFYVSRGISIDADEQRAMAQEELDEYGAWRGGRMMRARRYDADGMEVDSIVMETYDPDDLATVLGEGPVTLTPTRMA